MRRPGAVALCAQDGVGEMERRETALGAARQSVGTRTPTRDTRPLAGGSPRVLAPVTNQSGTAMRACEEGGQSRNQAVACSAVLATINGHSCCKIPDMADREIGPRRRWPWARQKAFARTERASYYEGEDCRPWWPDVGRESWSDGRAGEGRPLSTDASLLRCYVLQGACQCNAATVVGSSFGQVSRAVCSVDSGSESHAQVQNVGLGHPFRSRWRVSGCVCPGGEERISPCLRPTPAHSQDSALRTGKQDSKSCSARRMS